MHQFPRYLALLGLVGTLVAGCTPSGRETTRHDPSRDAQVADRPIPPPESESFVRPGQDQERAAVPWKEKFIPTGLASGVMIEFTGMKKDRQVNARFASVVLQPSGSSPGKTYTATINSLRQAFFEVPPGTYTLRQTKAWADPVVIRDVVVREGHYSLLYVMVLNPRASRSKEGVVE